MSIKTITISRELCEKLKYVNSDGELLDIYSLVIDEDEEQTQVMNVIPIRSVITHEGWD